MDQCEKDAFDSNGVVSELSGHEALQLDGQVSLPSSDNLVWSFYQCSVELQEAVRNSALPFNFIKDCVIIPASESLIRCFHSASKIVHDNKEYLICMSDYHVDDLFSSENSTLSRDEKSALTKSLEEQLEKLKLELNEIAACKNKGPLQARAAFPEIISEPMSDAQEPSVSQKKAALPGMLTLIVRMELLRLSLIHISEPTRPY